MDRKRALLDAAEVFKAAGLAPYPRGLVEVAEWLLADPDEMLTKPRERTLTGDDSEAWRRYLTNQLPSDKRRA